MVTLNSSTGSFKNYWLGLVVMLLLLLICLELFLRLVVVNLPRSTPALIDRVYQSSSQHVVAGDSQMYRAFLNQDDFVNLARRGNPIPAVKIVVEKYFSNKQPGQVILQASPQLFSTPQLNRGTQRYDQYFNLSMGLVKPYVLEKGITEFIKEAASLATISEIWQKTGTSDLEATSEQWLAFTERKRNERVRIRVEHHQPQWQDPVAKDYQLQYQQLISWLIDRGASLCLVRPPVNQEYLRVSGSMTAFRQADLFFKELASDYNIPFVDFQELPVAFQEAAFINQDHITPAASKTYSDHVIRRCFASSPGQES